MSEIKGSINVNTENIFPIIRQWLYTDKDIFLREVISNAADAITKLEHLRSLGKWDEDKKPEYRIDVNYDPTEGIISIVDNGIGMTLNEVDEFINQIAYSGAIKFIEQYKDDQHPDGVIGHFGLGFYSTFMVADKVRIETKSYQDDKPAVFWESSDGIDYTMGEIEFGSRGTKIIIHLDENNKSELSSFKIKNIINKYCEYMPYPIYFIDNSSLDSIEDDKLSDKNESLDEDKNNKDKYELKPLNNTNPLWNKNQNDCTDDEYINFYKEFFDTMEEPLFWIHLNMDYPFRMKGILYFPREEKYIEDLSGRIKVYYNQVFVADDVKEILPDYLFLLKGCIDSPDLPLNVSRSALQNNSTLNKVKEYISRKVADRLKSLYKKDRDRYNKYWNDLSTFVKYASLKDEKFYDRVEDSILLPTIDGDYLSLKDIKSIEKDKIYYTNDLKKQSTYIEYWKNRAEEIYIFDQDIDNAFIELLNNKLSAKKLIRVDAALEGNDADDSINKKAQEIYSKILDSENISVSVMSLGNDSFSSIIIEDEESRRMADLQKMFMQMQGDKSEFNMPIKRQLILNQDSNLVDKLLGAKPDIESNNLEELAMQLYDLAKLAHGTLEANKLSNFIKRSEKLLDNLY